MPIPNRDFDPSEVSVTWKILHAAGYEIDFSTADGRRGYADPAWVVRDGSYLSARWPGDVHTFAQRFVELIREYCGSVNQ